MDIADLDKQLDDTSVNEVAEEEEESKDMNDDGNEVNQDLQQENEDNDDKLDEQQTEEVSRNFFFDLYLLSLNPLRTFLCAYTEFFVDCDVLKCFVIPSFVVGVENNGSCRGAVVDYFL